MKMYLISDNVDTLIGMRLSGVEGVVLHKRDEIIQKLLSLMDDKDIAVILMTGLAVDQCRDTVYELKLTRSQPLIIEIPDRHSHGTASSNISEYVREAVGVKLNQS